ncbi:MAG: metallophosphoesterase, partial [Marmoricola sp.]
MNGGHPRGLVVAAAVAVAVLVTSACGSKPVAKDETSTYASTRSSAIRVVAVGDIACEPGGQVTETTCQQDRTGELAKSLKPDLVLALGDLQYESGTKDAFMESYDKVWGSLWKITSPAPGNHEYYTGEAAGYYDYFDGRQPGPPGYYRVKAYGWNIFVLNSNCDKIDCGAEEKWLDEQMSAHPSKCSLITMHHPRFSSGKEHGNNDAVEGLWRTAEKHRTEIALAGHDHDYERFAPLSPTGESSPESGISSFVIGTGGKNLYSLGTREAGSEFYQSDTMGVLLLELKEDSWTYSFQGLDGE